jgi:hypothetical protein
MHVEYEMSDDDLRALGRWVIRSGPYQRRAMRKSVAVVALCGLLLGLPFGAAAAVASPAVFVGLALLLARALSGRQVLNVNRAGRGVATSGRIVVEVTPDGVVERTPAGHSFVRWYALESVGSARDHLFMLISSVAAVIVPRRAFASDDEWRRFVGFATDSYQRALGSVPAA